MSNNNDGDRASRNFKMNQMVYNISEMLYQYILDMRMLLLQQKQELFPQQEPNKTLRNLSRQSRSDLNRTNKIINAVVTHMMQESIIKWYNIKIYADLNFRIKYDILIFANCYTYLLMNTNFISRHFFKKDMRFGFLVKVLPTLSPYLFLKIIWYLKCEDLLIESLVHIPLHLCAEILEIIVNNIPRLHASRTRRFIFLLIYKVYYKCLWLHLSGLSISRFLMEQLVTHFETLCNLLNSMIIISYAEHGIFMKNIVRYIRKCMQSKIESYSENHNLAGLFMLTYDFQDSNFYELCTMIKPILLELENKLTNLLLNQIRDIDLDEFETWRDIDDDENTIISLQRAIVMECNYFIKFMNQNEFLVTNQNMSHCLEQLRLCIVDRGNSNESTVTLLEFCQNITRGRWYNFKELMKRYKEWDLFILNFIKNRVNFLTLSDVFVTLEYLHYIFRRLHSKAEKYQYYILVLKILIQLSVIDLQIIVKNYVKWHFDDNPLEFLYNEDCFTVFIEEATFNKDNNTQFRILLIFILLNPRKVLTKLIMREISDSVPNILFKANMSLVREFYSLHNGNFNILFYILNDIIVQQHIELSPRFVTFLNNALKYKITSVHIIFNKLYVAYLTNNIYNGKTLHTLLLHIYNILKEKPRYKSKCILLKPILINTVSFLRRVRINSLSRLVIYDQISLINCILSMLYTPEIEKDTEEIYFYNIFRRMGPLEMTKLCSETTIIDVIEEYKDCFYLLQHLRTNPRCHPKLRDYVRSFSPDYEDILRHIILHSNKSEYEIFTYDLTFKYLCNFGWTDNMTAYENIMRISAEALHIVLVDKKMFPKYTILMCLLAIVNYSEMIESNMLEDYKPIRRILLKTLSSLNLVNETSYSDMYNHFLNLVLNMDLDLPRIPYYKEIIEWANIFIHKSKETLPESNSYYNIHMQKNTTMYNAYLLIHECIKLSNVQYYYSEQILHNLYQIIDKFE